jgi:hypothetical protein
VPNLDVTRLEIPPCILYGAYDDCAYEYTCDTN